MHNRNRALLVAVALVMAALVGAMLTAPKDHTVKPTVQVRTEPTYVTQVCPPLCGEPDTTTTTTTPPVTTEAPTTTTEAPAPPPAPTAPPVSTETPPGPRSHAWWYALAVCETGNSPPTDEWRTGYFGLEGSQPEGGRGWDAELAEAIDIYSHYGDSAWGCAPVAWSQVPGG